MSRVAVVTDTTGYLPGELVRAHGIHLVSLYVNFGGERTVREADITDYDRFYEELRDADALPTTSQPAVGDFLAVYEPLLEDGCDILSIHISAGLSGTCDAARQAVETLERGGQNGRVRVFDSATGAGGIALVALAAAKAAGDGGDLAAVEAAARSARQSLKIWFAIDTLEYLRRGGRIGAASATRAMPPAPVAESNTRTRPSCPPRSSVSTACRAAPHVPESPAEMWIEMMSQPSSSKGS